MAFLFPFFLENRVLRVFLAFHCMPRGYVSLLNYNNKGLQWCGCSPFVYARHEHYLTGASPE